MAQTAESDSAQPLSRNRDFILLWTGQALSVFGSRISWVAYPLLVLSLTHSPSKAGLAGFASWLPAVLFGLPAGAFVDRLNRKRVMIACDAARVLVVGSLVVALATGAATYAQILVVAFLERSLALFFDPAETGALRNLVPAGQLPTAIARNESREYGAFLLGPPVGGTLFGIARALPFLADAASYAASVLALLLIKRQFQADREHQPLRHLSHEVRAGLTHMWQHPFLRTTTLLGAGANFVTNGVGLAAIIIAKQTLHATPAAIGLMLTISGTGGLLGSLAAPLLQTWLSPRLVIAAATATWTCVIPLFLLAPNAYILGLIMGTALATAPPWNAVVSAYRISLIPDDLQGRVQSTSSMFSLGAIALGTLTAGASLGAFGQTTTIAFFTAVMALVASASIWAPSVKRCINVQL